MEISNEDILVLLNAIELEKKECKEFDKSDGINIDAPEYEPASILITSLMNMISYKEIRTQEAWISIMHQNKNSNSSKYDFNYQTNRDVAQELSQISLERRNKHNLALSRY